MKKIFLALVFVLCFIPLVVAQDTNTLYCEQSLSSYSEQELAGLGITPEMISSVLPCECYNAEPQYSQWLDDYCLNGKLQQTRYSFDLTPPGCQLFERGTEKQLLEDERCVQCPEPQSIGQWNYVACVDDNPLEQRQVKAYLFDSQGECQLKDFVEVRINKQGTCNAFSFFGLDLIAIILVAIAIVLAILLAIAIVYNKKTQRR